jgi:hypothetical protein
MSKNKTTTKQQGSKRKNARPSNDASNQATTQAMTQDASNKAAQPHRSKQNRLTWMVH